MLSLTGRYAKPEIIDIAGYSDRNERSKTRLRKKRLKE